MAIKRKVFEQLDAVIKKINNTSAIVASSTSNLAPSSFTHDLSCSARCIVAHPINPPFAIPCVEVVPAPWTSPDTVSATKSILEDIGQAPIVLKKEVDGFIVNRLQYAMLAEAFRLVSDGVCDPEDVDTAVSAGLGLRWSFMGPFETIDLNAPGGTQDYCDRYASSVHRVIRTQDNTRPWEPAVVQQIDTAMRRAVPKEALKQRLQWRDDRLMSLAVHKMREDAKDARVAE